MIVHRWNHLFAACALLALTAAGCSGLSRVLISNEQELEIGAGVDLQIEAEYRILDDADPVAVWARQLVGHMVPHSARFRDPAQVNNYSVKVIYDNSLVNAFAAPGGYTYIATGLVLEAATCAEIAGVMGHELAHVTQRHGVKRLTGAAVTLGLTSAVLSGGLTQDVIVGIYGFLMNTTFSRKDETEADEVGVQIMHASGYNPYALADFFRTLARMSSGRVPTFLSSHPDSGDRAEAIESIIRQRWSGLTRNSTSHQFTCQGTRMQLPEIKQRLQAGNVQVRPGTGTGTADPSTVPARIQAGRARR